MNSNTHSNEPAGDLRALETAMDRPDAEDMTGLPDSVLAERLLELRRLVDLLEDEWVRELADDDPQAAAIARMQIADRTL